jgi:hypothetical protein
MERARSEEDPRKENPRRSDQGHNGQDGSSWLGELPRNAIRKKQCCETAKFSQ